MLLSLLLLVLSLAFGSEDDILIWPYPVKFTSTSGGATLDLSALSVELFDEKTKKFVPLCSDDVIGPLVTRYESIIFGPDVRRSDIDSATPVLIQVGDVSLRDLQLGVCENYTLKIDAATGVLIVAPEIWGVVRAFETFAQLVLSESKGVLSIADLPISVEDYPRYPWRGLMIDTARHYLSVATIKRTIDAMSYNKMNTLHIHLVDSQSFPVAVEKYPKLIEAAWNPSAIYTMSQLKDLAQYAYARGVRIIPELDIPSHAASWGVGYPGMVSDCPQHGNVMLSPIADLTKQVVGDAVAELSAIFPDHYFHLGGDEISWDCWAEDKNISGYMKAHGYSGPDMEGEFMQGIYSQMKQGSYPVSWEERVTDPSTKFPYDKKNAVVQVWKVASTLKWVAEQGYQMVINSGGWYLDRMDPEGKCNHYLFEDTWMDFYAIELEDIVGSQYAHVIKGGEACMWSEQVNDFVIDARVWPRASAVAERLWSPKWVSFSKPLTMKNGHVVLTDDINVAQTRLMAFSCTMNKRGIGASPLRPNNCEVY